MTDGFFSAQGDSFAAEDSAELRVRLDEIETTVPRRTEGRTVEHRERYCIVHYLRTLERNGLVEFPFKITKGESPDFRIEMGSQTFGLEHADAGSEENQQALTELEKAAPGSVLEGTQIRRPGEALRGRPYAGDEPERLWTDEVLTTIKKKTQLLPTYEELPDYQLLLYDNTELGALTEWTVTELPERLARAIQEWRKAESGRDRRFSRISVLRDRVLMYDVTGSAFLRAPGHAEELLEEVNDLLIAALAQNPDLMHELHPRRFEELVAALFDRMGWEVDLTSRSRDGGRDVLAVRHDDVGTFLTLVECKRFRPDRKVGVALVRSLYGVVTSERASHGVIATTSSFSRDAREFQQNLRYQVSLRDFRHLAEWCRRYRRQ